jgi:hypothetical protein
MSKRLKMFYAMALACGLLMIGAEGTNLMAGENHHSSPNGAPKFIAPLRKQIKKIKREIREDQAEIDNIRKKIKREIREDQAELDSIKNDLKVMNDDIDSLTAYVEALETAGLQPNLLWINHLGFSADPNTRLSASFAGNPLGGFGGLLIRAVFPIADQSLVTGLQVPPGYNVTKVRLCYQLSSAASFITHIKIVQLTTASTGIEGLADLGDQTNVSPLCVDSARAALPINPANGPLRLDLGVTIADPEDLIVIRAVGLYLEPAI